MSNFYLKETRCSASAALALFLPGLLSAGEQGKMTREIWSDVPRTFIPAFTASARYWQAATSVSTFPGAASPLDIADNFASRVRAYISAPVTGNYTFWIASDDDSELRLSTDESKFNRVKIAAVEGWVNPQQWDAKTSQKSAAITLVAGQRYFIEALHLDGGSGDHIEIAWQVPGGSRELIPFSALESFSAEPNDLDNDELRDDWESAFGFSLTDNGAANPAQHPLADPDHDGYSNLEESQLGLNPSLRGGVPGSLLLETWENLSGAAVEDLIYQPKYHLAPEKSEFIFGAETPVNRADDFGARMRGIIIAPTTGNYTFYVAGDDSCQLWLSPSESRFAKQKIASVDGWTNVREWTKYPSQTSAIIALQAGQKYFVEAFLKEAGGGDHLEIGWKTPSSDSISVIPGSALESYASDVNDADNDNMPDDWETLHGLDLTPNDSLADPDGDGIPNHIELAAGSDPQTKGTISGGLLQELWLGIPGTQVAALTGSPKFLQAPNLLSLVTSVHTVSQPYDSFGSRLRGYLTAPVTGSYTFWVQGDDETEFWLSSTDSKFDKELLVRPTCNSLTYDTDLSQQSRKVSLIAGQRYYLEVLHKEA